jgi:amino acid transporter
MRIGSSIALIAIGLILALAVTVDVAGVDLTLVGWILTAVGIIGLMLSVAMMSRARRPVEVQPPPHTHPQPYEQDPRY